MTPTCARTRFVNDKYRLFRNAHNGRTRTVTTACASETSSSNSFLYQTRNYYYAFLFFFYTTDSEQNEDLRLAFGTTVKISVHFVRDTSPVGGCLTIQQVLERLCCNRGGNGEFSNCTWNDLFKFSNCAWAFLGSVDRSRSKVSGVGVT